MQKYSIKEDLNFLENFINIKGTRKKRLVIDNNGKLAIFKYEGEKYECTEACSEKLSYEIAKVLGYKCAKIELAKDEMGNLGILNYLFTDKNSIEHMDAVAYLNIHNEQRSI